MIGEKNKNNITLLSVLTPSLGFHFVPSLGRKWNRSVIQSLYSHLFPPRIVFSIVILNVTIRILFETFDSQDSLSDPLNIIY